MSERAKANIMLLITAIIWGSAFVAQKSGADLGGFTFNGIRTTIGGLVLLPFVFRSQKKQGLTGPIFNKLELTGGIVCGICLFVAGQLQQFGLAFTTAGKAAFITTLYVVFCPMIAFIFLKKKIRPLIWLCVALDCVGLYLLCMTDASFKLQTGDLLVFLCAICFAMQMTAVDIYVAKIDGLKLSCVQFLTAGILALIGMVIFERPIVFADICSFWVPILYAGVLSCGIGYTFQTLGQKHADATIAGLILCLGGRDVVQVSHHLTTGMQTRRRINLNGLLDFFVNSDLLASGLVNVLDALTIGGLLGDLDGNGLGGEIVLLSDS